MSSFRIDDLPLPGSPKMAMCMRSSDDMPNARSRTRTASSPLLPFFPFLPPSLVAALRDAADAAAAAAASGLSNSNPM